MLLVVPLRVRQRSDSRQGGVAALRYGNLNRALLAYST